MYVAPIFDFIGITVSRRKGPIVLCGTFSFRFWQIFVRQQYLLPVVLRDHLPKTEIVYLKGLTPLLSSLLTTHHPVKHHLFFHNQWLDSSTSPRITTWGRRRYEDIKGIHRHPCARGTWEITSISWPNSISNNSSAQSHLIEGKEPTPAPGRRR